MRVFERKYMVPSTRVSALMIMIDREDRIAATPYASELQIETPTTMKMMSAAAISRASPQQQSPERDRCSSLQSGSAAAASKASPHQQSPGLNTSPTRFNFDKFTKEPPSFKQMAKVIFRVIYDIYKAV